MLYDVIDILGASTSVILHSRQARCAFFLQKTGSSFDWKRSFEYVIRVTVYVLLIFFFKVISALNVKGILFLASEYFSLAMKVID